MTRWEYARLEYRATGDTGLDRAMDWAASFHSPAGVENWGIDERFNDLRHLNRAGAAGWEAYHRSPVYLGQPHRLNALTYSLRRPVPTAGPPTPGQAAASRR